MEDFDSLISIDGVSHHFCFRLVVKEPQVRYHISVTDKKKKRYYFEMEEGFEGKWRIIDAPKVPAWIHAVEEKLSKAILSRQQ